MTQYSDNSGLAVASYGVPSTSTRIIPIASGLNTTIASGAYSISRQGSRGASTGTPTIITIPFQWAFFYITNKGTGSAVIQWSLNNDVGETIFISQIGAVSSATCNSIVLLPIDATNNLTFSMTKTGTTDIDITSAAMNNGGIGSDVSAKLQTIIDATAMTLGGRTTGTGVFK
jgi:hypothetical protein